MNQLALETQLIELQTQLAFMEDTIDRLDHIVIAQSQQLADQQRQLQLLFQKLQATENPSQITPFDVTNDRPPHY